MHRRPKSSAATSKGHRRVLFNSVAFFVFFPIVLGVYYCLTRRAQNTWLVAASYVFYGWWDWRFCGLLAFSTVLDYFCARSMPAAGKRGRRFLLLASLVVNLGILGFFKYCNFFVDSAGELLRTLGMQPNFPVLQVILPVGISFYTFQTMAYTIDVYRGRLAPTRDFTTMALYVSFFPQLVAGPIERAQHLMPQFESPRRVNRSMLASGCLLILIGFCRKVAIADSIAPLVETAFSHPHSTNWTTLLAGAWLFSIQIYGDFAGYSDIARGTARLLGFELMENFNQPYFSTSITEFWRRWHISLSTWLRDYLYIPLGGNRHGTFNTYRNLLLTMILGGLWHGASWTFVVWGTLHGCYLAFHKWLLGSKKAAMGQFHRGGSIKKTLCAVATFHLVMLTWIFFRCATLAESWDYLIGILTLRGGLELIQPYFIATAGFYVLLVLAIDIPQYRKENHTVMLEWPWPLRGVAYAVMLILIIILRPSHETPFIYFQF